jgi:hypothetical protein
MEDEESIQYLCDCLVASNIQIYYLYKDIYKINRIIPFCWLKIQLTLHIDLP